MRIKRVNGFILKHYWVAIAAVSLASCGGGTGGSTSDDPLKSNEHIVTASFFKGPVSGATCELFETLNGVKSTLIATNTTDETGIASFGNDIGFKGTVLLECEGGTYRDEASENQTLAPTPLMRSVGVIADDGTNTSHFVISPLTEIATQLASQDPMGLNSAFEQSNYNQNVAVAFGLDSEINITTLVPVDLLNVIVKENSHEAEYAFAIALFSSLINLDEESRNLETIMTDFATDFSIQLAAESSLFSENTREELGDAAGYFTAFGTLVNSALQETSVRRDLINAAQLITPEDEPLTTNSIQKPIEDIRSELVAYILEHEMQTLPDAPTVTPAMYNLGQALAFDKVLSGNKDTSCLTCHHPLLASGDARSLSLGAGGDGLGQSRSGGHVIARHAQPLFNLDLFENLFWDGRVQLDTEGNLSTPADSTGDITDNMIQVFFANEAIDGFQGYGLVAAQAMFPVTDTHEMRGEANAGNELASFEADDFTGIWNALMVRLGNIQEYVDLFEAAYPGVSFEEMTFAHAANAIGAFEVSAFNLRNNPWQQVIQDVSADGILNNPDIFDENTTRGAHFFFETGCINCHQGSVMSDFDFHSIATVQFGPGKGNGESGFEDWGRELITGNEADRAKFRTAPLFNVATSAPYAHLGQFNDLWSHIQIYAIPERFWLNLYTGYDRIVGDFVHTPDFSNQVTEAEQTLLKTFQVPSFDGNSYGFFRTLDYISDQLERAESDTGRLTLEEGKRLGDGELNAHRQILLPFMDAQTDPAALDLSHLIPETVPSGLSVENTLQ